MSRRSDFILEAVQQHSSWPVPPEKENGRRSPVVSCTAAEDMTRQEYAVQSDIAFQIQRFGVGHQGVSGVVDFDQMDLTTAMSLIEESAQRWLELPRVIRDRYQSWANVEKAAQSGELAQVLKAAGVAAATAAAPAASPSESAADAAR